MKCNSKCILTNFILTVWSWKLSRTRSLSLESITAINTLTNNVNVINDDYFEPIQHTDEECFYLPDLAPGDPVVLVGQCDPNIAVVEDFDLSRVRIASK